MPFTKGQADDFHELRDLAYGWGKIVTRRAYGEEGPGLDLDFDSIGVRGTPYSIIDRGVKARQAEVRNVTLNY